MLFHMTKYSNITVQNGRETVTEQYRIGKKIKKLSSKIRKLKENTFDIPFL